MKNLTLVFAIIVLSLSRSLYGQAVVHDPGNSVHLLTQIAKAKEQIEKIKDQTKFLSDAKDAIVKVNNNVRQVKSVKRIIDTNTKILTRLNSELGGYLSSPSLSEQEVIRASNNFDKIFRQTENNIDFIGQILSDNYFKLSDYERLEIIHRKEQESIALSNEAENELDRLSDLISLKRVRDNSTKNAKKNRDDFFSKMGVKKEDIKNAGKKNNR